MAREFNGANQKMTAGTATIDDSIADKFTFVLWTSSDDVTTGRTVARNDAGGGTKGFGILMGSGNATAYMHNGSVRTVSCATTLSTGTWYHLGNRYNGSALQIFVNGASDGTLSTSGNLNPSDQEMCFGSYGAGEWYDGRIAESALWDIDLSDGEMASLGKGFSPLAIRPSSLVAYWPMIGRNDPETDLIGKFDLTLSNTPTVAEHPRIVLPRGSRGRKLVTAVGGGGGFSTARFRANAGLGLVGGGSHARANAGVGVLA